MYRLFYIFCFILVPQTVLISQNELVKDSIINSSYREDQFYIGATYNLLINTPNNITQSGFSIGLHLGFIRDFPINASRKKSIGIGLGLSTNSYNQNLFINEIANNTEFSVLDDNQVNFSKNKFFTHLVELPFELRWRNSTPSSYRFWRIYTGIKVGYMFRNGTKFEGDPKNVSLVNINSFNKFQYGLTFSAGYNTWNFHVYYALNNLFKDSFINTNPVEVSDIRVGLMFYLL